jgi:DNA-binding XRE family transcriptional regulator
VAAVCAAGGEERTQSGAERAVASAVTTRFDQRRGSFPIMILPLPSAFAKGSMRNDCAYVKYDVFNSTVVTLTTDSVMAESLEERFGKRCKKLRHQAGLSQLDMVREHGFSLSHYQKIERGTLDPRLSTLMRIAKSFGISVSDLVNSL